MTLEIYAIQLNFDNPIDPFLVEQLMNQVNPSKAAKLRRFVREEDRVSSLLGDLLVRDLIRRKLGVANHRIEFGANQYGKPYLKNRQDFHFNISHSGNWVVAAIDDQPVGIDIERYQPVDLSISRDYFSNDEHRDLMSQSDRLGYFFTLWSLKESYIKHLGKGLSHPLDAFSIRFADSERIRIDVSGRALEDVHLTRYDIDKDYKMGVCAGHRNFPKDVNILGMDEMIERFSPGYVSGRNRQTVPGRRFQPVPPSFVL